MKNLYTVEWFDFILKRWTLYAVCTTVRNARFRATDARNEQKDRVRITRWLKASGREGLK